MNSVEPHYIQYSSKRYLSITTALVLGTSAFSLNSWAKINQFESSIKCHQAIAEGENGSNNQVNSDASPVKERENVLLRDEPSKHFMGAYDYDQIQTSDFLPAMAKWFRQAREKSKLLRKNSEPPTFENTIMALEQVGNPLEYVMSVFGNYLAVKSDDNLQKLAKDIQPILSRFSNRFNFSQDVFKRVEAVYNNRENLNLNTEQMTLLKDTYDHFILNGINLEPEKQARLKEINVRLSQLSLQFSDNVTKYTDSTMIFVSEKQKLLLQGLPEGLIEAAAQQASDAGKKGWLFSIDAATFNDVLTYADKPYLRAKMWRTFNRRAAKGPYANQSLIFEIVKLREEKAHLLGFKTFGDFIVHDRMAKNVDNINQFLDRLAAVYKIHAERDFQDLEAFAGKKLKPWDFAYYGEKLRKARYDISDEELRPYFSLDRVIQGALGVAEKLYGIHFIERADLPKWDPNVRVYEVRDENNQELALFYIDPFARKQKRGGAWMDDFLKGGVVNGVHRRPHVINAYNLASPKDSKPSLLTLNEVTTVFHELGHGLHGMLTRVEIPSMSGAVTAWDAVELPSQMLENWAYEPEVLQSFAFHYQTNEPLPMELVDRVKKAKNFQAGWFGLRQVMLGKLDLAFNGSDLSGLKDANGVEEWERQAKAPYTFIQSKVPFTSTSFSHIFSGGYASGYYSYKWAEVLAADAFEYFDQTGLFNPEPAGKFRKHILEAGGSEGPEILYPRFRGRDADPDALLRSEGLIE